MKKSSEGYLLHKRVPTVNNKSLNMTSCNITTTSKGCTCHIKNNIVIVLSQKVKLVSASK